MRGSRSGLMPTPLSLTRSRASPPSTPVQTRMVPPAGVNLSALLTRLVTTCSSRVASPVTHTGRPSTETS